MFRSPFGTEAPTWYLTGIPLDPTNIKPQFGAMSVVCCKQKICGYRYKRILWRERNRG